MGNRGHVDKQLRARELRAEAWTLDEIARELDSAKSSASLWTRGVKFTPKPRNRGVGVTKPHPMHLAKLAEIEECREWGLQQVGELSDRDLFMAGIGLYAGDGAKAGAEVRFANSNPALVALYCRWLRRFFEIDESRLRVSLYLHEGLDLTSANRHWSEVTGIPEAQFYKPYRAVPDVSIRRNKHAFGCAHVRYASTRTLRKVLGLLAGLVS
ncbi:MAG: hypothetical protein ACR2PK_12040 [Acidimicrobiales bacterium]